MSKKFVVTYEAPVIQVHTAIVEVDDYYLVDIYHIRDALYDYGFDELGLEEFDMVKIIDGDTGEEI